MLDADVRKAFNYSPLDGALTWRTSRGWAKAGQPVAVRGAKGRVCLQGRRLQPARVGFFLARGYWPKRLYFKDGDPTNWALANLSESPPAESPAQISVTIEGDAVRSIWHGIDCGEYRTEREALAVAIQLCEG